ncbi:Nucleosome assembly protein isoform 2 [Operophtera brumata]|uniref:Nucleosome assembly protein isoform 2 n=1 Tax=Operophtera brumata TaxID=104452 RepID=A0A0L7KQL1_OPEBR|nr:Nucleosome assembly protein isoform 2 [Operophtera brumata]
MHHQLMNKHQHLKPSLFDMNTKLFVSPQGCEINWKKGKNVTVKTIKKKQKHKSRGSVRTVTNQNEIALMITLGLGCFVLSKLTLTYQLLIEWIEWKLNIIILI